MHESHRAEATFKTIMAELARHEASRVTKVRLVIGELSGADGEHIVEHLREYAVGTPLEGAEYELVDVPVEFECGECGERYGADTEGRGCPQCGSLKQKIMSGAEFGVESIDIE
jgi:hydrogenase nickel incorporation protein HypA/HybF